MSQVFAPLANSQVHMQTAKLKTQYFQNILEMNPISRKPSNGKHSRNSKEMRRTRDKPSMFKTGTNTSIGMTIGRMD